MEKLKENESISKKTRDRSAEPECLSASLNVSRCLSRGIEKANAVLVLLPSRILRLRKKNSCAVLRNKKNSCATKKTVAQCCATSKGLKLFCSGDVTYGYARTSFRYLQSAVAWEHREETDEELLEDLGRGWQGFGQNYRRSHGLE